MDVTQNDALEPEQLIDESAAELTAGAADR